MSFIDQDSMFLSQASTVGGTQLRAKQTVYTALGLFAKNMSGIWEYLRILPRSSEGRRGIDVDISTSQGARTS